MQRDLREVNIVELDEGAGALDGSERGEIVESVAGEIDGDGRRVVFDDGRDKDGVTIEELVVDRESVGILGIFEPYRVEDGCTVKMSLVEGGIEVIDETVPVESELSEWTHPG